jgi:hypothetical protein
MGYVGNQTTTAFTSMDKQDITGNGGPNYTLSHAVANANEIEVFVNNVRQEPTVAYSASGTTLTMTGNVASSDDFYVVYQGKAVGTIVPPDGSVSTAKIADDAVTNAKIDTVAASKLTGALPAIDGSALTGIIAEGTWTPILSFTNSNGGHTLSAAVGTYQKIGSFVYFNFFLIVGSKGSASGSCRVGLSNLGFTPRNTSSLYQIINVAFNGTVNGQDFEGERPYFAQVEPNDATLRMYAMNGNGGLNQFNAADVQNNTSIRGSGMMAI